MFVPNQGAQTRLQKSSHLEATQDEGSTAHDYSLTIHACTSEQAKVDLLYIFYMKNSSCFVLPCQWKEGARNTTGGDSGGRRVGHENMLLKHGSAKRRNNRCLKNFVAVCVLSLAIKRQRGLISVYFTM